MRNAGQFSVEHVAEVPRGYHVRTVRRGDKEVRIAYPPGRRRKGSGVVVEILRPAKAAENPSSVFAMAASLGYPYLRGEGRVAKDGVTWLSRVTKDPEGQGKPIFVGYNQATRKWVIERDETNPSKSYAETGGLDVKYSPVNQTYFLMWHDTILRIFPTKKEADDEMERLLRKPNGETARREQQRAARERAEKIRKARLTRAPRFRDVSLGNPPKKRLAKLTLEEDREWVGAFNYYVEEGKSDAQADRLAWRDVKKEFPRLRKFSGATAESTFAGFTNPGSILDEIRHGDRVTILVPAGIGREGQEYSKRTGRAMMRGPHGWVLDLGGRYGRPGIATEENIVSVRKVNPEKKPAPRKGESPQAYHERRVRELLEKMPKPIRDVFDRNPAEYKFIFRNPDDGRSTVFIRKPGTKKWIESYSRADAKEAKQIARDLQAQGYETKIRRSNPDEEQLGEAEALYETFHGRPPQEILEVQENAETRGELTALGDLVELTIVAPNREHVQVKFTGDGVRLASSPDGRQLYLVGGNQDISESLGLFGISDEKDFLDLGEAKQIVYAAAKWQTDFSEIEWKHDFGEESGIRPRVFFKMPLTAAGDARIFFAGGNYKVERPGIID